MKHFITYYEERDGDPIATKETEYKNYGTQNMLSSYYKGEYYDIVSVVVDEDKNQCHISAVLDIYGDGMMLD